MSAKHYVPTGTAEFTACRRRIANRLDQFQPGDSFTVDWKRVDCVSCLAVMPSGQPTVRQRVDHDRGRTPGRWIHDCESCIYLDTIDDHDLYFHPDRTTPTVISRHGDDPENYLSGLAFASREPTLSMALVLALKRGLIRFEDALRRI